jgi:integration host factor subunit alpha
MMMCLTKRQLTERLYDQCGFRVRESANVVDAVFEMMKSRLEAGEDIMISGFGNFYLTEKGAQTREESSNRGRARFEGETRGDV